MIFYILLIISYIFLVKSYSIHRRLDRSIRFHRLYVQSFPSFDPIKKAKANLQEFIAKDVESETSDYSELPDSFDDMIKRATSRAVKCIESGISRVRIDIDTSVGDMTYTSIKNTLPVVKVLVGELAAAMDLTLPTQKIDANGTAIMKSETELLQDTIETTFNPTKTISIFFPDMGAAALARRDWKLNEPFPEVAACVYTANIQNDFLRETDEVAIVLCPKYSETDSVKRIMDLCAEKAIPMIIINPELINMDQGFGVRARNVRKAILDTFVTAYKLQTLKLGALVREYPLGYSLWAEDTSKDEGYTLLKSFSSEPIPETIADLLDAEEERVASLRGKPIKKENNVGGAIVKEMMGFFKGLSKL